MQAKPMLLVLAVTAIAAVCTGGCKKSSETERREAIRAEVRAEEQAIEARKEAIDQKNDYVAAVRREQLELRGKLQEEIDKIDKKLSELRVDLAQVRNPRDDGAPYVVDPNSKDAKTIQDLLTRREKLANDADLVEVSDERGWDEIKATVERDLASGRRRRFPGKI